MSTQFQIIGAGMAGLFAAAVLREQCAGIIEAQKDIPHNHHALLRFKTSAVGDALNIPFRKVQVLKAVDGTGNPLRDAILYSLKVTGTAQLRSIISADGSIVERHIAPPNLVELMKNKVTAPISLGENWRGVGVEEGPPTISTMPMPTLMNILAYPKIPWFSSIPGYVITAPLAGVDLCGTMYLPGSKHCAYRASITDSTLIIEYACPTEKVKEEIDHRMERLADDDILLREEVVRIADIFGLPAKRYYHGIEIKPTTYAKILPIDDEVRKRFILWASDHFNIYSFGRFATWRPGLLMDDLVNDLRVIQRLAGGASSYDNWKG